MSLHREPRRRSRASLVEQLEPRLFLARLTGIDVSHFQGTMNWTTAVSRGISFALIRGSRTDTLPDTQLANNMHPTTGAKAKGLVVGVYHRILPFSNTTDSGAFVDPLVDAQNFHASAGAYMGTGFIRPIIDVENGVALNSAPVNGYTLSGWVTAWVNRLKQLNGNINPIIYTGHYRSNLNSGVVSLLPDLWIANWNETSYGNPITGTGGPPTSPWNPSPNWKFWQYDSPNGLGSFYGAQSTDIDLNVFNGDNINVLKQNFVVGAATIPSAPSPAIGSTGVSPIGLTLNWADSPGATRYDVYLDNMTTPAASNLTVSQWTVSPAIAGGAHSWKVVAKGSLSDDDTWVENATAWTFTASSLPLPGTPSNPNPHNIWRNSKPVLLDWDDASNASTYDVYLGTSGTPTYVNLAVSQVSVPGPSDGTRQWRVVAKNATGNTNGPQWVYYLDTNVPTGSYSGSTPTNGNATFDFTVTYNDTLSGVDTATFDNADVTVSGPNSYSGNAQFIGNVGNVATYRINAPGGAWDFNDNGLYTVSVNGTQVKDIATNSVAAGSVGNFTVDFASFAWMTGSTLNVQFDGTSMPITLATAGADITATRDTTTLNFAGVTDITVIGTGSDDSLRLAGAVAPPLTFNNSNGQDSVEVTTGTYAFASDIGGALKNLAVTVASGATGIFNATQHLRGLTVAGDAVLSAGGAKILVTQALAITGQLDLTDNDLVLDYTSVSPIGSWTGSVYTDLTGLIADGRNGGGWDGNGLTSSLADPGGYTTLGVAEATEALGIGSSDTALFGAETVDGSSVLVKYTYGGDANLSGTVDVDDYGQIDFNSSVGGSIPGFFNGDFDFSGTQDVDDYGVIDFVIGIQGSPL